MKLKWHPWYWESSWMSLESGWPECCTRRLFFPVLSDSSYFKTFLGLELWSEDNISLIVLWWGLKIVSVMPGPQEVLSEWKRSWKGKGHRLKKIFFFSDAPSAHKYSSFPSQMVRLYFPVYLQLGVAMWQTLANKVNRRNMCHQWALCHVLFFCLPW